MDMSFFTTIPGILIVCGAILLIIALVIFIVSASKSKKPKSAEITSNNVDNSVAPVTSQPEASQASVDVNANNIMPEVATLADTVVAVPTVAPVIPDAPVVSEVAPVVENEVNNVAPTVLEPASALENVIPTVDVSVAPIPNVVPEVQPVANITPMDTISTDAIETAPVSDVANSNANAELSMPEATNLDKTQVSVYGGVNPAESIGAVQEVKPVIYGGNDPLEATQKMPVVEENHVPYGGGIQMPSVEAVPTVPPVVPIPTVEESVAIPEVQPIPTVKPVDEPEEL